MLDIILGDLKGIKIFPEFALKWCPPFNFRDNFRMQPLFKGIENITDRRLISYTLFELR